MSLRVKLAWAFVAVSVITLLLAFGGLYLGLSASIGMHHDSPMMNHDEMMSGQVFLGRTLYFMAFSGLGALVVAFTAGAITAERITRSLRQLRNAAQHLGLRNFLPLVAVDGEDEIADLGRTFNRVGERLEHEQRARRQLLADVAHELRQPLAVLKGRLDLIQDGKVELDQVALLPLQDEVIRLTRLVGDLRDLSLAEVGGLSLQLVNVEMQALLGGLVDDLEPVAADKGITLINEIAPNLPILQADPDRIRQVFLNLLTNALQYTPEGGMVRLKGWQAAGELRFQVVDTGAGIAAEHVPHIFDRLYRADQSRARATGGSGLGLAIVRSLVELHRGRIEVESELGSGSSFTVSFPLNAGKV